MKTPSLRLLLWWLCTFPTLVMAQQIRGKISDTKGNPIPGASVQINSISTGTNASANGDYQLSVKAGAYQVTARAVGYETLVKSAQLTGNQILELDFTLSESSVSLSDVVILGSRSSQARTSTDTPVPVDVIGAKEMKLVAQTDITQIMNYVAPSFSSNRQTVSDGTDHIDPASLRGLGPDQVLVLVNGKRRHTTALVNINGTFGRGTVGTDLNAIPVSSIERIEVLRDGAAAQYGSDAIAGVINLVLKKETPWNANLMYGQSLTHTLGKNYSDGKTLQFDISKGFSLNNKGFVNIAAQYQDRGATNRGGLDTRPLLYSSVWPSSATTVEARQALKAADDAKAQAAGLDRNNMRVGNAAVKNFGIMANAEYQLRSNLTLYGQAGYTSKEGNAAGFYRLPSQTTQIDLTIYPNGFLPQINTSVYDLSGGVGLKGMWSKWNWDLSNTYGENSIKFDISNTLNASLPAGTSPTEFYAGKLKYGQNVVNLDVSKRHEFSGAFSALNTAFGTEFRTSRYEIAAGEEKSWSFGIPSENVAGRLVGTSPTAAGAQVFPGYKPANALVKTRTNVGVYADFEGEFKERLLLGAALRYENYSDFGSNLSYKATGRLNLVKGLALRGAVSTGFRAPSLHQIYFNNESTQFVNSVARQVLTVNNESPVVSQFGVGRLKPEISQNYSVGLTGKFGNFSMTIDAYQIDIKDRIVFSSQFARESGTTGTVNTILNTVDPTQSINSVQFFTNAIDTRTKGLDIVLSDRFKIGANTLSLTVSGNFNETKVTRIQGSSVIEADPSLKTRLFSREEQSRFESSVPKSKINLSASYQVKAWNFFLRTVRFGEVTYRSATIPGTTVAGVPYPADNDQTFSAKWVTDLTASYAFNKHVTLTVGANNLFDVYPDKAYINARNNQFNYATDATQSYTTGLDNTSNGRFLYSRAVSQFGFNGRFVFAKVGVAF